MGKITFNEQLDYCNSCRTLMFAAEYEITPLCCNFNIYSKNTTNEMCICSECIVKLTCSDICSKMSEYLVRIGVE